MFKNFNHIDLFGYIGGVLIILGFILLSLGKVLPHSIVYLLLQFFGGVGIVITALHHKDYPSGVLNILFSLVAVVSLIVVSLN